MDLAAYSVLALLLVIAVSCTSRVNAGVAAMGLAWLLVDFVAPRLGAKFDVKGLLAGFPAEVFVTLTGACLLFAAAEVNGTLERIAQVAQVACRGNAGLIPLSFFVLAWGIGSLGPGNIAAAGMLAPIAMTAAQRAGVPPLLMALMVGHGAIASSLSPFTQGGIVAERALHDVGIGGAVWTLYIRNAVANGIVAFVGYFALGGWKLLRSRAPSLTSETNAPNTPPNNGERVTGFTRQHVLTLLVLALVLTGVTGLGWPLGLAAFCGAGCLAVCQLSDERETFRKVPWNVIVMVCGVSLLTSLLEKTGGMGRVAELINRVSSPGTVVGVLAFTSGIVSIYSSTTGVVMPAFLPLVKSISVGDPLMLATAVVVGGNLVDMSPLSTIGALCLAAAPVAERRTLYQQLLAWGLFLAVVGAALCWGFSWLAGGS